MRFFFLSFFLSFFLFRWIKSNIEMKKCDGNLLTFLCRISTPWIILLWILFGWLFSFGPSLPHCISRALRQNKILKSVYAVADVHSWSTVCEVCIVYFIWFSFAPLARFALTSFTDSQIDEKNTNSINSSNPTIVRLNERSGSKQDSLCSRVSGRECGQQRRLYPNVISITWIFNHCTLEPI